MNILLLAALKEVITFLIITLFNLGLMPWKRECPSVKIPSRSKMLHYNTNGTGRDLYIRYTNNDYKYFYSSNSGGLADVKYPD